MNLQFGSIQGSGYEDPESKGSISGKMAQEATFLCPKDQGGCKGGFIPQLHCAG